MYREHRDLYTRIQAFDLDAGPSSRPFAARLAADNGWPAEYALRVIEEYRRFGLLAIGWLRLDISPPNPVGFLIVGLILTFGLACAALVPRLRRALRGDEALARARYEHRNVQRVGAESEVPDLLFGVALFGVGALAGGSLDSVAKALTPPVPEGNGMGIGGGA